MILEQSTHVLADVIHVSTYYVGKNADLDDISGMQLDLARWYMGLSYVPDAISGML